MKSPSTATVGDYTRTLGRSWVVVLLSIVGAAAVGWFAHTLQPPHYESQSKLIINVPGPATVTAEYAKDLAGRLRGDTYGAVALSSQVLTRVIVADRTKQLGDNVTVADLRLRVTTVAIPDSAIIVITSQGDSAQSAADLATLVARATKEVIDEIEFTSDGLPQTSVDIVDAATLPTKIPKTSVMLATGLGGGIGFGVALVALIGRDLIFNRVRDGIDALHSLRDSKGGLV